MNEPADLGRALLQFVLRAMEPLQAAASSETSASTLIELTGWDLRVLEGLGPAELANAVSAVASAFERIRTTMTAGDNLDLGVVSRTVSEVQEAVVELSSFGATWVRTADLPADLPRIFVEDLLSQLVVLATGHYHPAVRSTLDLLGILEYPSFPEIRRSDGTVLRQAGRKPRLNVDSFGRLLSDPADALLGRLGLAGPNRLPADQAADELFPAVAALLRDVGFTAWYGNPGGVPATLGPQQERVLAHTLRIFWAQHLGADGGGMATLEVAIALRDNNGIRELLAVPIGSLSINRVAQNWTATARLSGQIGPMVVWLGGVNFADGTPANLRLDATLDRPPGTSPIARLGAANGPRFEIGGASAAVFVSLGGSAEGASHRSSGAPDGGLEITLSQVRLVIAAPPGDGFLSSLLPREGLAANADLTFAWSPGGGVRLAGSATLDATVPIGLTLGPVSLDTVHFAIRSDQNALAALATADVTFRLGPVTARAAGIGLQARLASSPEGGNLGVANLELGFQPPSGAALSLDTGGLISGGGTLIANHAIGQYAGEIHLEFKGISVAAYGVLNTRMPDGSPILMPDGQTEGFSLVILINAEFTPIQLGFGFTLNGVGGLVGINRMLATDVLRAGIRNGTLQSVLFPRNPAENAPQILSTLASVFPIAVGTHVFGPMARMGWGTPPILTFDLGIVLEIGRGVRLALLGRLRMTLPDENTAVVRINIDVLGIVDFDRGDVSIDASLYDSQIAGFVITGDMALRASWGAQPAFALSTGGFNPRFQPPLGFPDLRRLAINLSTGENPRLRLEAYLALTSNTVQFGARFDLYAEAFGFNVAGMLAFDALIQLAPFGFVVDIAGAVALRRGNQVLMGVALALSLSGPRPWYARGVATFEIWIFKHSVEFEVTVGEDEPLPLPNPVNVGDRLVAALSDVRNWSAQLPPEGQSLVTLREIETPSSQTEPQVLAHPLGSIRFRQRVAPLGVTLERFGSAPIEGDNRFSVTSVTYGTQDQQATLETIGIERDYFARSQFFNVEEDEQLSAPSFELLEAGRRVESTRICFDEEAPDAIVPPYKTWFIAELGQPASNGDRQLLELSELDRLTWAGAAALSPLRALGRGTTPDGALAVRLHDTAFTVVDLTPAFGQQMAFAGLPPMTYAAAREELLRRAAEAGRSASSYRVATVATAEAIR